HDSLYFDIVLSDIGLPGESGIKGVSRIRRRAPTCLVMMLTVYDDANRVFQALCNGASGYLLKQTPLDKIREAIRNLYEDGYSMMSIITIIVIYFFNCKKQCELRTK